MLTLAPQASGRSGNAITLSLLSTKRHVVTALTRTDSPSTFPPGVIPKPIDYNQPATLVAALRGQDALIITLSVTAPPDTQPKLIAAAAEAGVPWILPNEWSPDSANDGLATDVPLFGALRATNRGIEREGKSSYVAVTTGFWYEWSLAFPGAFGFDVPGRRVTFFDEGRCRMTVCTWPQVGRAVASLLSLPVRKEGGGACLEDYRNKHVYVGSFTLSQRDMFASVLRVTGTEEGEWEVEHQSSRERYEEGKKAMEGGDREGFLKLMYTRVFFPDGSGDFEKGRGLANGVLGLPEEDLDEFTKAGIARIEKPWA